MSPAASEIHGYIDEDLDGQPTLSEVWPRFREFVGERGLVVHNGHQFDIPVIDRLTRSWQGIKGLVFFDSLPFARELIQDGGHRLVDLASRFGVDPGHNHRALDDSYCGARVFECLLAERARKIRKTSQANLLDCVALGAAIEGVEGVSPEDRILMEVGRWRRPIHHDPRMLRRGACSIPV